MNQIKAKYALHNQSHIILVKHFINYKPCNDAQGHRRARPPGPTAGWVRRPKEGIVSQWRDCNEKQHNNLSQK